jgi:hypothetical protein
MNECDCVDTVGFDMDGVLGSKCIDGCHIREMRRP